MLRGLTPKQKFMVNIGGVQRRVLLPNAAIRTTLEESMKRPRLFLQLELEGKRVPVYLSSSRNDFRIAFISLKHDKFREIGDLFKTDPEAAIEKGRILLAENPVPHWLLKFAKEETDTTRLHDDLQRLLQERLPKLEIITLSPEEFTRLWHSEGFTLPDPEFSSLNIFEADVLTRRILSRKISHLKEFLQPQTK